MHGIYVEKILRRCSVRRDWNGYLWNTSLYANVLWKQRVKGLNNRTTNQWQVGSRRTKNKRTCKCIFLTSSRLVRSLFEHVIFCQTAVRICIFCRIHFETNMPYCLPWCLFRLQLWCVWNTYTGKIVWVQLLRGDHIYFTSRTTSRYI